MANNENNRLEEIYKELSESFKKMDTISYGEVVDILKDEENHYQVSLYVDTDRLTDTDYCCISVLKGYDTSSTKTYLAPDQDLSAFYTNMVKTLREKEVEPYLQMIMYGSLNDRLACLVGKSELLFPRDLNKVLMGSLKDSAKDHISNKKDYLLCLVGSKEYFMLGTLVDEDTKKPKTIIPND